MLVESFLRCCTAIFPQRQWKLNPIALVLFSCEMTTSNRLFHQLEATDEITGRLVEVLYGDHPATPGVP